MSTFERYAPFIQDYIYSHGWKNLRAIQSAAADAIFNTDKNVLLCASTASGKTEAAFFPILTLMSEQPPASVGVLYIAPLKALINDQFSRLNDICEEGDIPVWHWHGDVSQSEKKKLMKHPSGILQITPESLEAIIMRRRSAIPSLFGDLRFIVIDEIHAFLRGDRGGQTLCLIQRLCRIANVNPRRIGLSATVGEPMKVAEYLSFGSGRGTIIPHLADQGVRWRLSMEHFYSRDPQAADTGDSAPAENAEEKKDVSLVPQSQETSDEAPLAADPSMKYIFEHTRGRKCLVFSNSREECEAVTSTLRAYCEAMHEPDRFLIHHGNLSVSYRESAEEQMKEEDNLDTICTTATLELGIDIGKLERAFQIDAPYTVSSFLQRMGRTGRRGAPSEMWFVMKEDHPEPRALLPETIPWSLIQGCALVQLYVEERWVEPPREGRLPYSLLYHQTMSTLAGGGAMSPAKLASQVLSLSYFRNISQDDFRILLRHLLKNDQIEQTEDGNLIPGLAGERIVNNFKFYAVFMENEEYAVRWESQELGSIVKPPPVNDLIAIAGRVWVVEEVDRQRHQVYCHPVKGSVPAYFGVEPGDLHTRIMERAFQVLKEDTIYPYLLPNARARLRQARESAMVSGIWKKPLICMGGDMYALFPWLGSYAFLALERFLRITCKKKLELKGFMSLRPYYMEFTLGVSEEEFYRILDEEIHKDIDPMTLLFPKEEPVYDKYDDILPTELTRKGFAMGVLDVEGMKKRVLEWVEKKPEDSSQNQA